MYYYDSPIGKMYIRQESNGKYSLNICDTLYGYYPNAISAADDVYVHVTGCYAWDSLDCTIDDVPTDITEWTIC